MPSAEGRAQEHEPDAQHMNTISSKRILVVDTDPSLCEFLRIVLVSDGHVVEEAHNHWQALSKLDQGTFDVIFADRSISEVEVEPCARQNNVRGGAPPWVRITGTESSCLETEASRFAVNPFDLSSIREALAAI